MTYRRLVHTANNPRWSIEKTSALSHPWQIVPPGSYGQSVRASCFRSGEDAIAAFNGRRT